MGRDEILLAACDDGDVIGYRVHEIQRALEMPKSSLSCDFRSTNEDPYLKLFLHRNVGASAWGLAIHRNARVIAISANTHRITVLAFALSDSLPSCKECTQNTTTPDPMDMSVMYSEESQYSRKEDLMFELSADANIPAVSFNNTGEDPTGHWLFSCSIDGKMMLWNLHKPGPPSVVFQIGWCASVQNPSSAPRREHGWCACQDSGSVPHGIWGALPLNTHAAYEISPEERDAIEVHMVEPCFEDVTEQKNCFFVGETKPHSLKQPSNPHFPGYSEDVETMVLDNESDSSTSRSESGSTQDDDLGLDPALGCDLASVGYNDVKNNELNELVASANNSETVTNTWTEHESSLTSTHSVDLMATPAIPAQTHPAQGRQHESSDIPQLLQEIVSLQDQESTGEVDDVGTETAPQFHSGPAPNIALDDIHDQPMQIDAEDSESQDELPSNPDLQDWFPNVFASSLPKRQAYCEIALNAPACDLPSMSSVRPCVVIAREEIYLIQRPYPCSGLRSPKAIVTMRRPLYPGPYVSPYLAPQCRLCYLAQVGELGIFVVGSPIGRAAVFSLYYTKSSPKSEPEYGFKLEYMLPFDRNNDRQVFGVPYARLLGIAVAPVQGTTDISGESVLTEQNTPQNRRWRLLMYYTDHTVLSFELSKRSQMMTPDVHELIV